MAATKISDPSAGVLSGEGRRVVYLIDDPDIVTTVQKATRSGPAAGRLRGLVA